MAERAWVTLSFFFTILFSFAVCQPRFTSTFRDKMNGTVGAVVNFTWSFTGQVRSLSLMNGSSEVIVIDSKLGVTVTDTSNKERISVVWDGSSPGQVTFLLNISSIFDEGTYNCVLRPEALDFVRAKSGDITLVVFEPPKIDVLSVRDRYKEGFFVNITCKSRGKPEPSSVKWLRNGNTLDSGKTKANLIFQNISRNDDGNYLCQASNGAGRKEFHFKLVVIYKPEGITLTTNATDSTVIQGDTVTFTCGVAAAQPKVSLYQFYLNNGLVSNSSAGEYTIANVNRSQHHGDYKCVPHNDAGDGLEATVLLNINVPVWFTVPPQNLTTNLSDTILLGCDALGFPTPDISWKKSGKKVSDNKQLKILNSTKNDAGQYTCTASNRVGKEKTAQAYVTVQYPPTIQDFTASSKKSWIGQTVTLTCTSDGLPTPTLNWSYPDGRGLISVIAKKHKEQVALKDDLDFGDYKCAAYNGLQPSDYRIIKITQIKKPGEVSIISNEEDIQASSLTVRWTAPADNGGSPITAYYVIIQEGDTRKGDFNSTAPGLTRHTFGGLERDTNYTVKVLARNFVFEGDAAVKTMRTKFQGAPAVVEIDDIPSETKNAEITLSWEEPEDNGEIITEYFVYQRLVTDGKGGQWLNIKNITGNSVRELKVPVEKGKEYEFAITAKNAFGEGLKQDESRIRGVKAIGIPGKVEIYDLPDETSDNAVTLRWKKPEIYGKEITQYTVYRRTVTDGSPGKWRKLKVISDVKVRELRVNLQRGIVYQFAVTATNDVGEGLKPDGRNIPQVKALGSPGPTKGSPVGGKNGMNTAIYSGAAVAGVLLIIGIIVIIVLWRRRKPSSPDNDEMAMDGLGSANHYDTDDGYQEVSRAEAAQRLQASGPDDEANYAQVDMTKKKKSRPPPSDEYAQVDKSKKTKKRPKRPGELDYADLEDLRMGLVPGPSAATAAAAVVRPPAYEGTDYADITQFGVPQPDPTYANVSKGDVMYSNMQSM